MVKHSISQRSPLSPTLWPPDAFAWPRSLLVLAIVVVAFFIGQVVAASIALRLGTSRHDLLAAHLTWGIAIGQFASYIPLLLVLVWLLPWLARRSLAELGLRPPGGHALLAGILGALAMYAITIGAANIEFAITHQKPEEAATSLFASSHDPWLLAAFAILAAFVAPFMEELGFRGFIFNALLRYMPVWLAAVISGCIFGLSHGSPTAFVPLALSGVVLAYVYYLTGSLTASMITHGLFNVVNLLLISVVKS